MTTNLQSAALTLQTTNSLVPVRFGKNGSSMRVEPWLFPLEHVYSNTVKPLI